MEFLAQQIARVIAASALFVGVLLLPLTRGQNSPILKPAPVTAQIGLHYYALVNTETGQVVQRGKTGSQGVAFDQLILAPGTHYRIWVLQAATLLIGYIDITAPPSGATLKLPQILLGTDLAPDDDQDGLSNDAEFVVGTDPKNPDSDGDGVTDGAAVRQGLDPLNGKPVRTGIIGNSTTPAATVDICAVNDVVITADQGPGISVFNVFNGMSPKVIAQVSTPAPARAVSSSGNLVAVASDSGGLVVIDISDPPAAKIIQQVNLGGTAQAVATVGTVAYVGLASGYLLSVDMPSGTILGRVQLNNAVQDIAVSGDAIYVLTDGFLKTLALANGVLQVTSTISAPGIVPIPRRRLFAGTKLAYAVHARGYTVFDLSNPMFPALIKDITTAQVGWKQIVANGSGMALAAVGPNRSDDGTHDVSVYALSTDGTTNQFITTFLTPGIATAVAIYNGIAYVADGASGMEVLNYLPYDNLRVAPTINLVASFPLGPGAQVEEAQTARLTANVIDDVQVRNVEFYVDGVKVFTDGNYPFEYHFITPNRDSSKTNFTVRARAADTGGNATWTDEITVALLPNTTPPEVRGVYPPAGSIFGAAGFVAAYFNKTIVGSTLTATNFQLRSAGPDKVFGTGDDTMVTNGVINFRPDLNAGIMTFAGNLAPGLYMAIISGGITDALGDPLSKTMKWTFGVLGRQDSDQDGIPDDMEVALGLDPTKPSTFNDGILDGDRDLDGDGLKTSWELFWGYNPLKKDSLGDGVSDGLRDPDRDALNNLLEQAAGTNPFAADTDGDGWNDETEISAGSDPFDPNSKPSMLVSAVPSLSIGLPRAIQAGGIGGGLIVAQPPVIIGLPSTSGDFLTGLVVSYPPLILGLPSATGNAIGGVTVGYPTLTIGLSAATGDVNSGVTIAYPPLKTQFLNQ